MSRLGVPPHGRPPTLGDSTRASPEHMKPVSWASSAKTVITIPCIYLIVSLHLKELHISMQHAYHIIFHAYYHCLLVSYLVSVIRHMVDCDRAPSFHPYRAHKAFHGLPQVSPIYSPANSGSMIAFGSQSYPPICRLNTGSTRRMPPGGAP